MVAMYVLRFGWLQWWNYSPECIEEDGSYTNFLESIEFKYNVLANNVQLSPPANMYNYRGPCLRHGVVMKFHTALECVSICGGMDYTFSSGWLQIPTSMVGNTWMIQDVLVGHHGAISRYRRWFDSLAWCWRWVWTIGNWMGTSHILQNTWQLIYEDITTLLWRIIPLGWFESWCYNNSSR